MCTKSAIIKQKFLCITNIWSVDDFLWLFIVYIIAQQQTTFFGHGIFLMFFYMLGMVILKLDSKNIF